LDQWIMVGFFRFSLFDVHFLRIHFSKSSNARFVGL
jgi:hypothetical protein